jgi:hypothetical protein
MRELTVAVSDEVLAVLRELATRFGMTPEAIAADILRCHAQCLNPHPESRITDEEFRKAVQVTLEKNAELYRRLAQH